MASTAVQTCLGLGGLAGTALGGFCGQWAYNRRRSYMPLFMGGAAAVGVVPFLVLLNLPRGHERSSNDTEHSRRLLGEVSSTGNYTIPESPWTGGALGGGASWTLLIAYMAAAVTTGVMICITVAPRP